MLTPITIFTGFLGSGKTTVILNLLKQLPKDYKLVMLKNEFGNTNIDSKLGENSNLEVKEIINGCLCCILVGKLNSAVEEIIEKYHPDRIIIETSGSAYPTPMVLELKNLNEKVKVDGVITVIDALNYIGYKDISYTAKIQAKDTDLILINKWELVNEEKLDKVIDSINELNSETPKIKTQKGVVSPNLIFGLDSKLLIKSAESNKNIVHTHFHDEVDLLELMDNKDVLSKEILNNLLNKLPAWDFYRIKGFLNIDGKMQILNYAFGKWDFTTTNLAIENNQLVFMGKNLNYHKEFIAKSLNLDINKLNFLE